MSHYSWKQYNISKLKLSKKLIKFNKKHKINYIEKGLYNHVRDLFCVTIALRNNFKKKVNVLDYGSNLLALSNIISKINTNQFNFSVYDPFLKKNKKIVNPFKINFLSKSKDLIKKEFHIINFGSSIQYLNNIDIIKKEINFKKVNTIIITNTPISINKAYISKQSNHPSLVQNVYTFKRIEKFFKDIGFNVVFVSRNEDQYIACEVKKSKTYSLNLILKKN